MDSEKASVWDVRPFQIVSLLEMIKFRGSFFFSIARKIEGLINTTVSEPIDDPLGDSTKASVLEIIRLIFEECKTHGLKNSASYADTIKERVAGRGISWRKCMDEFSRLQEFIETELTTTLLMQIPVDKVDLYKEPNLFGQQVANNFPSASFDIEEAGKCYATGVTLHV